MTQRKAATRKNERANETGEMERGRRKENMRYEFQINSGNLCVAAIDSERTE